MSANEQDQYNEEFDDTVDEEYLGVDEVAEEEEADGGEEYMDDEEEGDQEEYGGFHGAREVEGDDSVMEIADDSVQGFFEHKEPVYAVAMHPTESNIIVSGGGDDKSHVWRADTGEKLITLDGHTDSVTSVAFSVSGEYIASGGMDGKVRVWKSHTGEFCTMVDGPDEIIWLDWHPKGNVLLAGATDSTIWMWAMPSGKFMNIFNGHAAPVTAGEFTADGKHIVSVSEDSSLIVWDPKSAASLVKLTGADARFHSEPIIAVCTDKESNLALTGSADGTAKLINLHSGNIIASLENHSDSIETVSFCDALPLAATGSVDSKVSIWDIQTHRVRHTLLHEDAVIQVKFVSNSVNLVTCSADRTVRLWDARNGQCLKKWMGHQDAVLGFAVSSNGDTVVTGSDDGTCLVFKA
ncbi:60S ribosomal subunit assembly or modification protein [Umbelopsis sp. WA50703]